jgi:PEP-CTERM motif
MNSTRQQIRVISVFSALLAFAFVSQLLQPERVQAQVFLNATDDCSTSNDTSRGPTATNDRIDFIEIRNFLTEGNTRKRVGFFKYDISGIDPLLYQFATLTGVFTRGGNGTYTVYGLNDGLTNSDNGGTVTEANWSESTLSYSNGLGVDVNVAPGTVGDLGIDPAETTLLGTITLVNGQPLQSNPTDLPLSEFLSADTNNVVTFLLADLAGQTEWRMTAREASSDNSLRMSFAATPGDTDLDGVVELEDLDPIRANYRHLGLTYGDGDLSGDGTVDFRDFRIWKTAYLNQGSGSLSGVDLGFLAGSVPEPTTLWLAAAAGLGLVARRRSRRRQFNAVRRDREIAKVFLTSGIVRATS